MRGLIVLAACTLAIAQDSLTPQQRQEILDYPLSMQRANQLFPAMEAMSKYVASLPDFQSRMQKSAKLTPAQRLAEVENDPKAVAILKQNRLTAKEYLVGVPALRWAIWLASGRTTGGIVASPANLAFAKANLAQLKPKMDAADGIPAPPKGK